MMMLLLCVSGQVVVVVSYFFSFLSLKNGFCLCVCVCGLLTERAAEDERVCGPTRGGG